MSTIPRIFISYSHQDGQHKDELLKRLKIINRNHPAEIDAWHDGKLLAGDRVDPKIRAQLDAADLVCLLISPDFIASDYCYIEEMTQAMANVEQQGTRVVGRKQTPWEESSLRGDFYFIDQVIIKPPQPQSNTELEFWNSIKNTDDPAYFKAYIEQYGDQGLFTRIAKIKLTKLERSHRKPSPIPVPTVKTEPVATRRSFEPEVIKIHGGTFNMGSPKSEEGRDDDEHLHAVQVDDFWMGKTERSRLGTGQSPGDLCQLA